MKVSTMENIKRRLGWLWPALLVGVLVLSACGGAVSVPRSQDEVPRIAPQELKRQLDSGQEIVVVDTRSAAEYQQRRIPGAVSIPANEMALRLDELPRDQEIVLYCT